MSHLIHTPKKRPKTSPKRCSLSLFVSLCHFSVTQLHFSDVHPSVTLTRPGQKHQLVSYWSVTRFFLQAFCKELVLSNHTVHLSHSFRLRPVINKQANYQHRMNLWSIKQCVHIKQKSIRLTAVEPDTVHKDETQCAKYEENNFQKDKKNLLDAWGEWAFHMRAQIFSACLTLSSYKPTPPCDLHHVSSDLRLQIGHFFLSPSSGEVK